MDHATLGSSIPIIVMSLDTKSNTNSKVDKVTEKVTSLDLKLELVLKSLSKIKVGAPLEFDRSNQLDQLISLCLKHILEQAEER